MKKPVASQIKTSTAAITPPPIWMFLKSGGKRPPVPRAPAPRLPPPIQPFNLRLKSRHSSSKSGGPAFAPGRWPALGRSLAGLLGGGTSGRVSGLASGRPPGEGSWGLADASGALPEGDLASSARPQRLSLRLNIPRNRPTIATKLRDGVKNFIVIPCDVHTPIVHNYESAS